MPRRSPPSIASRLAALCLCLAAALPALAQPLKTGKEAAGFKTSAALLPVEAKDELVAALAINNPEAITRLATATSMLDDLLLDRLQKARGLNLVTRTDLSRVLDDQDLQQALGAPEDESVAQSGEVTGGTFVIAPTVSNFEDIEEKLYGEGNIVLGERRQFRMLVTLKILDAEAGTNVRTFTARRERNAARKVDPNVGGRGDYTGSANADLVVEVAEELGSDVMDFFFPAKVIGVRDGTVTISRGQDDGVVQDQLWDVFAPGEKLFDPTTGTYFSEAEEVPVGVIRVVAPGSQTSRAEAVEDFGIAVPDDIPNNLDKLQTARLRVKDSSETPQ